MPNGFDIGQFGASDVSLIKSIIEEKRDFIPYEAEFRGRNETRVSKSASFTNSVGTKVIFIVPENSTLFITAAYVTIYTNTTTTREFGSVTIFFDNSSTGDVLLTVGNHSHLSNANNVSLSFPMPIKVDAGQRLVLFNSQSDHSGDGGIIGWLEKKEVLTTVPVVAPPQ